MHGRAALKGQGDLLAAGSYMVLAGLFGGGIAVWSPAYALLVAASIALAALLAWRDGFNAFRSLPWTGQVGLLGIAILPLLQLVPLPPALWQALPGQTLRYGTLTVAGMADTWQPLSLEPASTALCAILAIGFVALVGFLLRLSDWQFRRMLLIAIGLILAGMAVGLLQVVGDGRPRFYSANADATMLGFFANKNHMALAIACSILIVGAIAPDLFGRERRRGVTIGYVVLALVSIVTTNSRAGLALGGMAAVVVLADLARGVALRWRVAVAAAFAVLLLAILSSSVFQEVSGRVGDTESDLRWKFLVWAWPLARQYWLLGSGLGSFATLFAAHEQLAWVKPTYVNAAHNDYYQLLIEAGVPGVLVLVLLLGAVVRCLLARREQGRRGPGVLMGTMGFAVLLLFALHSGLDYPLRRPAAWSLLALALAAVFRDWRKTHAPSLPQAVGNDPT